MITIHNPHATVVSQSHKAEAQQAIDELLSEHLIPFKLKAEKVACDHPEYTVWFFDSRLHSVTVRWNATRSFKDEVRAALLDRVSRFSGVGRVAA